MNLDEWCHYSDMPSPKAYQKTIYNDMTKSEIISRIIELETPIVERIINDRNFRASDKDEYQSNREELKMLRELIKDEIYPQVNYWIDQLSQQEHATNTTVKSDD